MEKGSRSVNRTDTINLPFALLDLVQLISFHEVFAPGRCGYFSFKEAGVIARGIANRICRAAAWK